MEMETMFDHNKPGIIEDMPGGNTTETTITEESSEALPGEETAETVLTEESSETLPEEEATETTITEESSVTLPGEESGENTEDIPSQTETDAITSWNTETASESEAFETVVSDIPPESAEALQPNIKTLLPLMLLILVIGILLGICITALLKGRKSDDKSEAKHKPKNVPETTVKPVGNTSMIYPAGESDKPNAECNRVDVFNLEIATLQGIGKREEQQDAFGFSKLDDVEKDGLLAIMCDGMGGMAEGGMIARETVNSLLSVFPFSQKDEMDDAIRKQTERTYRKFRAHGGATLVASYIKADNLHFWCVGDSCLYLVRNGEIYLMNILHEYKNDLLLKAIGTQSVSIEMAYSDPQGGKLTQYIGRESVNADSTRIPFKLEEGDTLLMCSDGISDVLTQKQITEYMSLPLDECCKGICNGVYKVGKPNQDNFTAVIIRYHNILN